MERYVWIALKHPSPSTPAGDQTTMNRGHPLRCRCRSKTGVQTAPVAVPVENVLFAMKGCYRGLVAVKIRLSSPVITVALDEFRIDVPCRPVEVFCIYLIVLCGIRLSQRIVDPGQHQPPPHVVGVPSYQSR